MKHQPTEHFWKQYQKLPPEIKRKAKKAFSLFKDNPSHPSLRVHPIQGTGNPKIYEGYVDKFYRFTFHYDGDTIVYRKIGPHSIIDAEERS